MKLLSSFMRVLVSVYASASSPVRGVVIIYYTKLLVNATASNKRS